MTIYLRWYYGYKNRWDELLLFWVLWYLQSQYAPETIIIQSDDVHRLQSWIGSHTSLVKEICNWVDIKVSYKTPYFPKKDSLLVLWWWEIMTDARPFPYNWWTYLKFLPRIISKKTVLLGWLWTIKSIGTWLLYTLLLWTTQQAIVRERNSYKIGQKYTENILLYHDFAYDVLDTVIPLRFDSTNPYIVLNINTHIRVEGINRIKKTITKFQGTHDIYFFPGTIWEEDADADLYNRLLDIYPWIILYNRTKYSLSETLGFIQWADFWIAARLHIVLLLKYFDVDLQPLIYQEKVQRVLDHNL